MTRSVFVPDADAGSPTPSSFGRGAGLFLAWAACGAFVCVGLAAAFTPLIVLLLPAGAAAIVLLLHSRTRAAMFGLVSGAAVVPARIGWTQRCYPAECSDGDVVLLPYVSSPWPAVLVALALVAAGVAGYLVARHRGRRP